MSTIKLKQPEVLPASGLSHAVFKPWKNQVIAFVQQDLVNFNFCPGGRYASRRSLSQSPDGKRIVSLAQSDPDKLFIEEEAKPGMAAKLADLKLFREAQLAKFLQHIASFCHYTEQADVVEESTSVQWIWTYLEGHYDIQTRGSHFLKIADISYTPGSLPQVYYKQLRSAFVDNLRVKNDVIKFKNDTQLTKDEEVSLI